MNYCRDAALALALLLVARMVAAQAVSFGNTTAAEKCAEAAATLGPIDGITTRALGLRVRTTIPGWRSFKGTDDELGARFLKQNACLSKNIRTDQCTDVQGLIDETTVGTTLGAKLKVVFPAETTDMREKYAEMFVRSFCPRLTAGIDVTASANSQGAEARADVPISVWIEEVAPDVDGFVPPERVGVREGAKALADRLFADRDGRVIAQARNKAAADVLVRVVTGEVAGESRVLRATVTVESRPFTFEAIERSWDGAAKGLATQMTDWARVNRDRIIAGRRH